MQNSQIPLKWYKPFAADDAAKVEIPVTTPDPTRASQSAGFPPLTMQPPESGGVPPQGEDFNGAMNQVARIAWWLMAGGALPFDAIWAGNAAIGGYPQGGEVASADLLGAWISTADNNTNNPDTVGTGWVPGYAYGRTALAGLTNADVTLTPAQAAKPILTLAGVLTGNIQIIFPTWLKHWVVVNNCTGAFSVTCKTAAGSGVVISQGGGAQIVWGDGTNLLGLAGNSAAPLLVGTPTLSTQATPLGMAGPRAVVSLSTLGAGNWTVPAGVYSIEVALWAGGGGGGGSGGGGGTAGGGGGSGHALKRLAVTPGQVIPYFVGSGGAAGGAGGSGSTGTATTFNGAVTANPGVGGTLNPSGNGGAGGIATGGDVNMSGGPGGTGAATSVQGGSGGTAAAGGGGGGGAAGIAGAGGYPGGGGGGGGASSAGGAGADGLIVIRY